MRQSANIRPAAEADAGAMLGIYAPVVLETAISFELEPPTLTEFQGRIRNTLTTTPWLVCEIGESVSGYAYAGPYRTRPAYRWSAETTVYVHTDFRRRGVGRALYSSLFACLRVQGYVGAYAAITLPNPASVALHERMRFTHLGTFCNVGFKLGRWHDVGWWQRALRSSPADPDPPTPFPDVADSRPMLDALSVGLRELEP